MDLNNLTADSCTISFSIRAADKQATARAFDPLAAIPGVGKIELV